VKKYLALLLALALCLALFVGCNNDASSNNNNSGNNQQQNNNSNNSSNNNNNSSNNTDNTPAAPKILRYGVEWDITSLDPQMSGDSAVTTALLMTNEGLLRDKGGEIVPGIAETWEISDDGLTYTFHLRQSKWSDGSPLTAKDFKYAFIRMLDPAAPTNYITTGYILKNGEAFSRGECGADEVGVECPDDYTLVLNLEKRDNNMLYNLSRGLAWLPINEAADKAAGGPGNYGAEMSQLMTNGPFTVTEWKREASITFTKNPNYWNADEVHLDGIYGIVGASDAAGVDMMLAGELDLMPVNTQSHQRQLEEAGFTVEKTGGTYNHLYFNGNPGENTEAGFCMANVHFRRAINYVIDRNAMVSVMDSVSEPAFRVIMPNEPGVDGKTIHEMYPYTAWDVNGDINKAKEELAIALQELGLSDASQVPALYLLAVDSAESLLVLQAFQNMLKTHLGIESTVNPLAVQQMREKWITGYWDVFHMSWGFRAPNWGQRASNWYRRDGLDHEDNGYYNEAFDNKYEEFQAAESFEDSIARLAELEKIFCDDAASGIIAWTMKGCAYDAKKITGVLISTSEDFTFADMIQ